jgi:hypothetical protein
MFRVSEKEWKRYVEPRERDKMLCRHCYDQIKAWIDDASEARHSRAVAASMMPLRQK